MCPACEKTEPVRSDAGLPRLLPPPTRIRGQVVWVLHISTQAERQSLIRSTSRGFGNACQVHLKILQSAALACITTAAEEEDIHPATLASIQHANASPEHPKWHSKSITYLSTNQTTSEGSWAMLLELELVWRCRSSCQVVLLEAPDPAEQCPSPAPRCQLCSGCNTLCPNTKFRCVPHL